jgi:hypothetical protein
VTISWDDLIRDAGDAITSFEPIPEGDYDLECVDAKVKPTKDGKKKMFEVKCKVVGGAHNGRFIWDNIVLTTDNPNALGFFFKKMAGFGLTADYFKTQRPSDERIVGDLKGRRLRAKIGHRVWNGEKKNEVKNYYPQAGAGGALPPSVPGAPPMPAAPPAPAPAPQAAAPAPAAPQPPAPPAPVEQPQPPVQDPWAAQAPAAPAGDPWAQQPAAPAAPPAPPAQEYQAPPAPPAAPAQQEYQAPPAPPAPPAAPAPEQQAPPAAPEQPQAAATPPVPPPPAAPF